MAGRAQPHLELAALLRMSGLDHATVACKSAWHNDCSYEVDAPQTILAEVLGTSLRTVGRWASGGIPLSAAEDAAHVLGLHPCEIWGNDWIEAALS